MVCRCVCCCNYRFGYFLWSVVVSAGFTIGLSAFLLLEVAVSAWFMSGLASFYYLVLLVFPRLLFRNRIIFNAYMILTRIAYCWEIYFNNRIINLFTFYIWESTVRLSLTVSLSMVITRCPSTWKSFQIESIVVVNLMYFYRLLLQVQMVFNKAIHR